MQLELEKGGEATLVTIDDDRATLSSPTAAAPGSRLGLLVGGRTIRLKVHRCVREGDRFTVAGRFIDLTRDLRDQLANGIAATPADDPRATDS
jgi:hypothetical protein